jgi:hypothetical protein
MHQCGVILDEVPGPAVAVRRSAALTSQPCCQLSLEGGFVREASASHWWWVFKTTTDHVPAG